MKAHFKYPRKIDGVLYGKGEHTLPDTHADHKYVKALIQQGDIAVLAEKAEAPIESEEPKSEDEAPASQPQGKQKKAR